MAFDVSLYEQAALFVYALFIGVLIGAVYDLFRVARIALTFGRGSESRLGLKCIENLISRISASGDGTNHKKPNKIIVHADFIVVLVCDILFFLATAVVSIVFLYQANYGQPRLYVLISAILGFVAYYNTVGRCIAFTAGLIISVFRLIYVLLVYRLVTPLIKVTCRAISVPIETLELKIITVGSDAFFKRLDDLSKELFGYMCKEVKKEDGYENRLKENRYNRKNNISRFGAFLHRKDNKLQN